MPGDQPQRFLVDGAHNAAGATALRAVLAEHFQTTPPTLILGILDDKDWGLMCEILAPLAHRIICVPVPSERSVNPSRLVHACRRTNPHVDAEARRSLADALESTAQEPFVVVAGSLYLVGEALRLLQQAPAD
jgi:dihydrofolate synthase/folylpolyglutamate synthase